jgi:1,4-dihydroxy-2-naphthoyl-CoA synthase
MDRLTLMTDQAAVLTERRDGVLLITLNRPDARNAVNLALVEGVTGALDELDAEDSLSVGILTGAGKGFSPTWTSKPSSRASVHGWATAASRELSSGDPRSP